MGDVIKLEGKQKDWSADYETAFRKRMERQAREYMEENRRKEAKLREAQEKEAAVRRLISKSLWLSIGAMSAAVGVFAAKGDMWSTIVAGAFTIICIAAEVVNSATD